MVTGAYNLRLVLFLRDFVRRMDNRSAAFTNRLFSAMLQWECVER